MSDRAAPVLELRGIEKRYPGVIALDGVDLEVRPGEVHALLGENGAGKSTLIKVLAGVERPDAGDYLVDGSPVTITSPRDARDQGVSVVFQELNQVDSLSVAENLFFGRLPGSVGFVDRRALRKRAAEFLAAVGLDVDPDQRLGYLSVAQRQLVEIAGALSQQARVIAMDEPTSALSHAEIETLFGLVDQLREDGVGIIYVSHKLDELHRLSDRITVLRDGGYVDTVTTSETSDQELIQLMVGRELTAQFPPREDTVVDVDGVPPALEVTGLSTSAIREATFSVREGEVVGFSGLMGSGRTELARAVFGLDRARSGSVLVGGVPVPANRPDLASRAGIGYVPEDRKASGLVVSSTIRANMTLAVLRKLSRFGFVQRGRERALVDQAMADLRVKAPSGEERIGALSGGNQQKVTLARWLIKDDLKVLLLDEPTRGIDVNAKAEIYRLIAAVAHRGVGVVVLSSELPEILGLCDRVFVLRSGQIVAEHDIDATQEELMQSALGGTLT